MFALGWGRMLHRMPPTVLDRPRPTLRDDAGVSPPPQLPPRLTPLIGRAAELAELFELLGDERMVTLTGSGGCGKTRLAVELAARTAADFPGGVVWVELASCSDGPSVIEAVNAAFDVVDSAGDGTLHAMLDAAAARPGALIVLDNAEHVVTTAAAVVSALTTATRESTIICTSREPLGVLGEVVWRVPSLSVPPTDHDRAWSAADIQAYDAVALFADRARRSRRGFAVDDANAAAIAQICARLDGVPLAIELAAARVRTMRPERIAAELDDRFRLLAGGPRTLLARQQTMHASVAWSEGLLDDAERAAFHRLGVFVGGFTVEAAEAVVGEFGDIDRYDVAEIVRRLVDKSLVHYDEDRDRYRLLDTIRSYALTRLIEAGHSATARTAQAEWCAGWLAAASAESTVTDANEWWASRLRIVEVVDAEWANCAAALEWAEPASALALRLIVGLGDYWAIRQRAVDSARFGMPSIERAGRESPGWVDAVVALQAVRTNAGDATYARLREEALAIAGERGDERTVLRLSLGQLVARLWLLGPRPDELAALDRVRERAVELGEWYTAWNAIQSPAVILAAAGRPVEAVARVAGLSSVRATLIRAFAAQLSGDTTTAVLHAAEASRRIEARLGAGIDRLLAAFRTATLALATTDPALLRNARLAGRAEMLPRPFLSVDAVARAIEDLLDGRLDEARATLESVAPDVCTSWWTRCLLAPLLVTLGRLDEARAVAEELASVGKASSSPIYEAVAALALAECADPADTGEALDLAHRSLAAAAAAQLRPTVVDALEAIGVHLHRAERERDAARLLAAAESARTAMTYRFRFPHRAAAVDAARAALIGDDGWVEGRHLTLDGAVELAQRMRGERTRPAHGWDSLTPTEERVADRVAEGLTNPQIAEVLFMSRATVKTHLVHIYAKLAITTRAELAAAVARRTRS